MSKNKEVAEAAKSGVALPQDWQSELAKKANESAANVRPASSVISLKSGIVSYQGVQAPDNKLDVVIIGFAQEHTYYGAKYDPDNVSSPDCYALAPSDMEERDIIPAENVENPQNADCHSCPQLQWGSQMRDGKPGKGKACQQRYRLIAIPASALTSAETVLGAEAAIIKLPVTSGKVWAQYLQTVASVYKRPEWGVITTVSAKPDVRTQFKAVFTVADVVDFEGMPELYPAITQKIGLVTGALMKGYDLSGEAASDEPNASAKHAK